MFILVGLKFIELFWMILKEYIVLNHGHAMHWHLVLRLDCQTCSEKWGHNIQDMFQATKL